MLKKLKDSKKPHQFIYSLIIVIGIVAVWRGVWGLLDIYLFANDPALSFASSFVVGVIILGVTHYQLS